MSTERNDLSNGPGHGQADRAVAVRKSMLRRAGGPVPFILHSFPTLLVLVALGGVAKWGHHNGWRAPKFTSLFGATVQPDNEDWCLEHNVPESRCIKCHPELAGDNAADWCKEHGVAESRCTVCHPEILTKGIAGDWCKEHGVPESGCTLCHPEIAVKGNLPQSESGPRIVPPESKPPKDPSTCQTHALRVQFASAESVKKAGVQLGQVIERPMENAIVGNAETQYDQTRLAQVASRLPGVVWRVDKQIGEAVHQDDVLALIDAAEVGRTKAELLTAMARRDVRTQVVLRIKELLPHKISTVAELQEAEASLREAEIRAFNARQALINFGLTASTELPTRPNERELQLLGLPESVKKTLDSGGPSANLVPLLAPLDGIIIERKVVAGAIVEASVPLFTITDPRRMWLLIDLPQKQIGRVAVGEAVQFQPERSDSGNVRGTVTWISTQVDDQTRTVKVRAEVDNTNGQLLASTFGRARVIVREAQNAIAVPNEAIQWEGCCHIVFVRLSDEIFQTRKVQLGARDSHYTEIIVGVLPGEIVATAGSHVLKSEILKSNLGAGCTDD